MSAVELPPHGTVSRRKRGCRCDDCSAAWARRWDAPPLDEGDESDQYARSHGIPEGNVLNAGLARRLRSPR